MTPLQRARRQAARSHAALSNEDGLRCGLTQRQIDSLVERGEWLRPYRGVYTIAGAPSGWRQRAMVAVFAGPARSVASHTTAAALHGLWRPPATPHITVPPNATARVSIARVHRSLLRPGDRMTVDGIPCTTPTRAIVEAAGLLARPRLELLVDDAFCSRLSCIEAVEAALGRAGSQGRRGVALLRAVVEVWTPGIQPGSPAEMRLLRRLREWGYEQPDRQVPIVGPGGRYVVDLGWPARRVGFEYESDRWHNPRRWERDERRDATYQAAGWTVLAVGKPDLLPSSDLRERVDRAVRVQAAA